MKAKLSVLALATAGVAGMMASTTTEAATILEVLPVNIGHINYMADNATDNQTNLTYDNSLGAVTGDELQQSGLGLFSDRTGYFDLGEDWANLRIYETWSYARYQGGGAPSTPTGFSSVWWSNAPSAAINVDNGDVPEETLNFLLNSNVGQAKWVNDVKLDDSTAITPQGRYFVFRSPIANDASFSEIAFVGVVVPEPASLSILGLGGLALLARRRRQA